MLWNDESSFGKSDTDRTPNSWTAKAGKLRIHIHRHIHYPKDTWLLTCAPFFDKKVLESKDADEVKAESIKLVRCELKIVSDVFGA